MMTELRRLTEQGEECCCHAIPPCGWCSAMTEAEAEAWAGDGMAGLQALWSAWDELQPMIDASEARAEAAEQRAEAAERELAQARADRTLMTGLWLGTVPHDVLPALFPETLADRGRITAALAAVDLQASAAAHIAAGRAVIARIVAEMGGGAA